MMGWWILSICVAWFVGFGIGMEHGKKAQRDRPITAEDCRELLQELVEKMNRGENR